MCLICIPFISVGLLTLLLFGFQDITHNLSCDMLAQGRHDAICLRKRLTLSLSLSYVQCFRICSKTAATRTCENIWPAMDEYSLHLAALETIHLDIFARENARRGLVRCVYFALKTFFFSLFFLTLLYRERRSEQCSTVICCVDS